MTQTTQNLTAAQAAQMGSNQSGSAKFGPLTVTWNIDLTIPRITADATLFGVSIGHVVIDPQHPTATIGGSVGFATAELILTADFTAKELDYNVDVEAFGHVVVKKSGKLIGW